jgi:hypothetical protein
MKKFLLLPIWIVMFSWSTTQNNDPKALYAELDLNALANTLTEIMPCIHPKQGRTNR